jgi:hypothetical protein
MKYFPAVLALAGLGATAAPASAPTQPDLRRILQQYDRGIVATPRELTPLERAELRRQLSEQQRRTQPRR